MVSRATAISLKILQDSSESVISESFSQKETNDSSTNHTIVHEEEIPPLKKLKHLDPLDDSIFMKRLGESLSLPNLYGLA